MGIYDTFVRAEKIKGNKLGNTKIKQWRPSRPGDSIRGEYIKTEEGKGNGKGYVFHILEDGDGELVSIFGCKRTRELFANAKERRSL